MNIIVAFTPNPTMSPRDTMFSKRKNIEKLAQPLLNSMAFRRLSKLSFLGVLSPKYRMLVGYPYEARGRHMDGNRAQHSIGVASITLEISERIHLSFAAQKYAAAWALLHDIATWPLSHTGEAGFNRVTGTSSRRLRQWIIEGSDRLPRNLTVYQQIKELDIQHDKLLALFDRHATGFDDDIRVLHALIHSPITPDTLEGMKRSGMVFGVSVPEPETLTSALYRDIFSNLMIDRIHSKPVVTFWRSKAKIYERYINNARSIEFESAWSRAIEESNCSVSLSDSLQLSEKAVIDAVLSNSQPKFRELRRYKQPLDYFTTNELARRTLLREPLRIEDLNNYLLKREKVD